MRLELMENGIGKKAFFAYGEDKEFICLKCRKPIKEGYLCEVSQFVLCNNCQNGTEEKKPYNMSLCKHDKMGEHRHTKFIKGKLEKEE